MEFAPIYFDVNSFPDGETKRALLRVINKKAGKIGRTEDSGPSAKKQKRK
jgi:pre-mRNA-splicing factor ATP-dependent RNA helicase DHX15/PRP43